MTQIPNFATIDFAPVTAEGAPGASAPWLTPEGIAVNPVYGPADLAGLDFLDTYPGIAPYLRGPVGSSRVDLQACKLEYSIVSPK